MSKDYIQKQFNHYLYYYAVAALMLPNIALCITEHLSLWASAANLFLPLGIYMWLLSLCKKTGKMIWGCFILCRLPTRITISLWKRSDSCRYVPQPCHHQPW